LIIAKLCGKGTFAEEILKVAEDHKIPLFEDKNLANLLIKLEVDTEVPAELYTLVAEVLAFVFRLDQMVSKRKRFEKKASQLGKE
jgi:flagellar biosynthesis protein